MDNDKIKIVLKRLVSIPTLPAMVRELLALLQQKDTSADDLQKVITKDPAIAVKVLKLVNSSYYGFPSKIASIHHAVVILGFNTLRSLVLSISAFDTLSHGIDRDLFDFKQYSIHSNACAITAKIIAKDIAGVDEEDAFAVGLLHDIGKVLLCRYFTNEYKDVLKKLDGTDKPAFEVEQEILDFTHADVGGVLAEKWKLPEKIQKAVTHHHAFEESNADALTAIVHLADIMCCAKGFAAGKHMETPELDQAAWDLLKIPKKRLIEMMAQIDEQISKAIELFENIS